jgi:hypothetical protein
MQKGRRVLRRLFLSQIMKLLRRMGDPETLRQKRRLRRGAAEAGGFLGGDRQFGDASENKDGTECRGTTNQQDITNGHACTSFRGATFSDRDVFS